MLRARRRAHHRSLMATTVLIKPISRNPTITAASQNLMQECSEPAFTDCQPEPPRASRRCVHREAALDWPRSAPPDLAIDFRRPPDAPPSFVRRQPAPAP